jgi:predicted nucleic acid-binding protein
MMIFLDSSALFKRYVEEDGSDDVRDLCAVADAIGTSALCLPEILSAAHRLKREGRIDSGDVTRIKQELRADLRDAAVMGLNEAVIERAASLVEASPLKTLDALHVATAVEARADLFVSGDEQQLKAARKAGLKTRRVGENVQ